MKFGHSVVGETFFFKNLAEYEAGRLIPDHFLFFKKFYMR